MDDAPLVRGFEGFRNLLRDGQGLVGWNRTTRDALREIRNPQTSSIASAMVPPLSSRP